MLKFREMIKDVNTSVVLESITKENWSKLKELMTKSNGFKSWEFDGDYEVLVIGFKDNTSALNAHKKNLEFINSFGSEVLVGDSKIEIELNKNAMNALDTNESKALLEDNSVRDYVDNRLEKEFKKNGFKLPENGPTVKIGYTVWPFMNDYEVINDGVGIKIKKDGKEVKYFDNPKLSYKDAVEFLSNSIMNESDYSESEIEKMIKTTFLTLSKLQEVVDDKDYDSLAKSRRIIRDLLDRNKEKMIK